MFLEPLGKVNRFRHHNFAMTPEVMLEVSVDDQTLLVTINAEALDAANCGQLRDKIKELSLTRVNRAEIDMRQVQFLDSSGAGALISVYKLIAVDGRPVILLNAQPPVLRVVRMLRLDRVFQVE